LHIGIGIGRTRENGLHIGIALGKTMSLLM
jgi:hypothetical protein